MLSNTKNGTNTKKTTKLLMTKHTDINNLDFTVISITKKEFAYQCFPRIAGLARISMDCLLLHSHLKIVIMALEKSGEYVPWMWNTVLDTRLVDEEKAQ